MGRFSPLFAAAHPIYTKIASKDAILFIHHRLWRHLQKLEQEILAAVAERTEQKIKIDWQFSIQAARAKLNSHYVAVQTANEKFKET